MDESYLRITSTLVCQESSLISSDGVRVWFVNADGSRNLVQAPSKECQLAATRGIEVNSFPKRLEGYTLSPDDSKRACASPAYDARVVLHFPDSGQKLTKRHVLGRPEVVGDVPHHNLHRVVERHVASIRAHALPVGLVGDGGGMHVGDEDPLIGPNVGVKET